MIVVSPLVVLVALLIRALDGAPVLYRQVRVGLNGKKFTIWKFRTMARDSEAALGVIWAVPNDPRCTRLGSWLRRFGLDELPQLWNVLCGQMSLVGPRPERPELVRQFRLEHRGYTRRHAVRPGITGYAQVHGWRGYTSLAERLRHDHFYIDRWSLALDIRILLLTLIYGWSETTRNGAPD